MKHYCDICDKSFKFKFIRNLHQKYKCKCCVVETKPEELMCEQMMERPQQPAAGYYDKSEDLVPENNPAMFKKKMNNMFKNNV
jgi:hypothetical protein